MLICVPPALLIELCILLKLLYIVFSSPIAGRYQLPFAHIVPLPHTLGAYKLVAVAACTVFPFADAYANIVAVLLFPSLSFIHVSDDV